MDRVLVLGPEQLLPLIGEGDAENVRHHRTIYLARRDRGRAHPVVVSFVEISSVIGYPGPRRKDRDSAGTSSTREP